MPMAYAEVWIGWWNGPGPAPHEIEEYGSHGATWQTETDADGRARLPGITAGAIRVLARIHRDGQPLLWASQRATLAAGQTLSVTLEVKPTERK